jgi:hypothetical protein
MADDVPKRNRSGSEVRQKDERVTVRYTQAERSEVQAAAVTVGLTEGAYIRVQTLSKPKIPARRRPTVELVAVARLQGELNRIGGNIHQLLKDVRFGGTPGAQDVRAALGGYEEAIEAIKAFFGRSEL